MLVPDLAEVWLSQLEERASEQCLRFDLRYIRRFSSLCPICGQFSAERDPYPGVQLETYLDLPARAVIPFWACCSCVRQDDTHMAERLRCRFSEFLTD